MSEYGDVIPEAIKFVFIFKCLWLFHVKKLLLKTFIIIN